MTLSEKLTELAAEVASIEARAAKSFDADIYKNDASMWRTLYYESEQERLNLLGVISGEQIP